MIKYFVVIFLFTNSPNLQYIGQSQVATGEECLEKVLAINKSDDTPYNAMCLVNDFSE
jgi:hypothetical protein